MHRVITTWLHYTHQYGHPGVTSKQTMGLQTEYTNVMGTKEQKSYSNTKSHYNIPQQVLHVYRQEMHSTNNSPT